MRIPLENLLIGMPSINLNLKGVWVSAGHLSRWTKNFSVNRCGVTGEWTPGHGLENFVERSSYLNVQRARHGWDVQEVASHQSKVWQQLFQSRDSLLENIKYRVDHDACILFWLDIWFGKRPLASCYSLCHSALTRGRKKGLHEQVGVNWCDDPSLGWSWQSRKGTVTGHAYAGMLLNSLSANGQST